MSICSCTGRHAPTRFFFNDTATTEIYTLSLHDALPILTVYVRTTMDPNQLMSTLRAKVRDLDPNLPIYAMRTTEVQINNRSEEHTSELQSQSNLVCRLLLEKKKLRPLEQGPASSHFEDD